MTEIDGKKLPLFAGVWAIFGHGNVAGIGEALQRCARPCPPSAPITSRRMAHAAVAFAKASRRRRMMACTTSIGPGATNMVTAAAVAACQPPAGAASARRRLRQPPARSGAAADRGLFGDGTVSANDCFRPVSRYFDRITRPEQIIPALQRAMTVLTDPAECGPVTLALCQDAQAEAYDYPESFFAERIWTPRRIRPDETNWPRPSRSSASAQEAVHRRRRRRAVFRRGRRRWRNSPRRTAFPVGETQAGKSSLPLRPRA